MALPRRSPCRAQGAVGRFTHLVACNQAGSLDRSDFAANIDLAKEAAKGFENRRRALKIFADEPSSLSLKRCHEETQRTRGIVF